MILFFFFFFQAEDGIRDFHVTGVQTCALPISNARGARGEELPANGPRCGASLLFDRQASAASGIDRARLKAAAVRGRPCSRTRPQRSLRVQAEPSADAPHG